MNHRGFHVMLDYKFNHPLMIGLDNLETTTKWLMQFFQSIIQEQGIRVVHKHCEIFDGGLSPPGFAMVLLLDESHLTAHCYSDQGMLAIDIFTCGTEAEHKTSVITQMIDERITCMFSGLEKAEKHIVARFPC